VDVNCVHHRVPKNTRERPGYPLSLRGETELVAELLFYQKGFIFAHGLLVPKKSFRSLGISVVGTRILGCEHAYARSHPKIRPLSRQILENWFFLGLDRGYILQDNNIENR